MPEDTPFENKQFDNVDEYLNRLQSDLEEKGYDIEWGERFENSVKVIYEGNVVENLRVPTDLDKVNLQLGPMNGYDMMVDVLENALHYDKNEGDLPFLNS